MSSNLSLTAILWGFLFLTTTAFSGPKLKMEKKLKDFGDIKEGEVVSTVFVIENTGDAPLIINDVVAPCGCTIPEFTNSPILPGQQGQIKVTFKSEGKSGVQRKAIKVISNAENELVFQITANVLPK